MTLFRAITFTSLLPLLTIGCGSSDGPSNEVVTLDAALTIPGPVVDARPPAPARGCDKIDFLFVIDNSGSMGQEQANLQANFPLFLEVFDQVETKAGEPIDYRVGAITTGIDFETSQSGTTNNVGDNGELITTCGGERPWIERGDEGAVETLTCLSNVGTQGPWIEMPLEAIRLATGKRLFDSRNSEFFRDDALFATVILTDEDDCSSQRDPNGLCNNPHSVDSYVNALDAFKGRRSAWATSIIAGLEDCTSDFGSAVRADRLIDFASKTGNNAVTNSICEADLANALRSSIEQFEVACEAISEVD